MIYRRVSLIFEQVLNLASKSLSIRGHTSGLANPTYVVDAPGGGGKIPLLPEYLIKKNGNEYTLRNYQNRTLCGTCTPD